MVIGALIASGDDLTFNWSGYVFLTMNNVLTAAQGVVMKRKLLDKVKEILEWTFESDVSPSPRIWINTDSCSTIPWWVFHRCSWSPIPRTNLKKYVQLENVRKWWMSAFRCFRFENSILSSTQVSFLCFFSHRWWDFYWIILQCYVQTTILR